MIKKKSSYLHDYLGLHNYFWDHKPFLDWKWNRFRIPRQRELVKVYFGRYVIKIGQKCTPMHFWDSHDLSWPHSDHLYHHCSSNFWIIVFHTLFSWRKFIFQSMPPSTNLRYPLKLMCKIGHSNESKGPWTIYSATTILEKCRKVVLQTRIFFSGQPLFSNLKKARSMV